MPAKRAFLMIMDSFGIGEEPDAPAFGDFNVNTLRSCTASSKLNCPNLAKLGLFQVDGVKDADYNRKDRVGGVSKEDRSKAPAGSVARMRELSAGKDTIIGHWELAGLVSPKPMPTFPNGFPQEFLDAFSERVGRKCFVNKPYSGTEVIRDFGMQHLMTGDLIVYTSADSVFQIAANKAVVPLEELYRDCEIAREMLRGDLAVGRVIARPFVGDSPENFKRTSERRDYALSPFAPTMIDKIHAAGMDTIGVGKIGDIFNGQGLSESTHTSGNADGCALTSRIQARTDWKGLCFVNLVDFDMLYGHRRDIDGYANAISEYDQWLTGFMKNMKDDDVLMISADHGCDPAYDKTTDHTREYVPLLMYGKPIDAMIKEGRLEKNNGTRQGFTYCADTVLAALGISR